MKDAALEALYKYVEPGAGLLLADEQCTELLEHAPHLQVVTNRVDVARRFEAAGFSCRLNDFSLDQAIPARVYYRVSKEKALVHHLINKILAALPIGGRLLLSGFKGDGTKTYIEKAAAMVGAIKVIEKPGGGALLGIIEKHSEPQQFLDDSDYAELQNIGVEQTLFSKPGVYGWKKIDSGSALLAEQLPLLIDTLPKTPESVLDLGCGYGYLSVMAKQCLPEARIVATDNNVTALLACDKNFEAHAISGETLAEDCGGNLTEKFDLIVCNPPFHKGFDVHGDLTLQFLQSAKARMKPGAAAVFVVNQFIGLEQRAKGSFGECRLLAERDGFKVFLLR